MQNDEIKKQVVMMIYEQYMMTRENHYLWQRIAKNENVIYIKGIKRKSKLSISKENISIIETNIKEKIKPIISNEAIINIKEPIDK